MKRLSLTAILMLILAMTINLKAEEKLTSAKIKSPVQCEMCDATIKKGLAKVSGIDSVVVDLENQIITVAYDEEETSIERIRRAISKLGYDADDVKADPRAYSKLSKCCKKPEDR